MRLDRRFRRRAGAEEWVEHGVADEREHPNQTVRNLDGKRRRMSALARRAGDVVPDRAEPARVILLLDQTENALLFGRRAIAAGLSEKQDVLDVVLDDRVRLVRFAEERRAVAYDFRDGVGDLEPEDRR